MGTMERMMSAVGSVALLILMGVALVVWKAAPVTGSIPHLGRLLRGSSVEAGGPQEFGVRPASQMGGMRRALTEEMMSERCARPTPVASPAPGRPAC